MVAPSRLSFHPLPLPPTASSEKLSTFGRLVKGYEPSTATEDELKEIQEMLFRWGLLVFKGLEVTPKEQYELTKSFDTKSEVYGHGTTKVGDQAKSILHPDLKTIPHQPQVQLIGNGLVPEWHGLINAKLKHPHHKTFHRTVISPADEAAGITRFYRWHIDAALYDLSPPIVTTLFAVKVPKGGRQTVSITVAELMHHHAGIVVDSRTIFSILPAPLQSLAIRTKVRYAPHPYVWMAKAHAMPTGLGIESEGLELGLEELPAWEAGKIKDFPICWKNPVTGEMHFQVHPCGAASLLISPLPSTSPTPADALYPEGGEITDLATVRSILYSMQRPGIAPDLVYPVDWEEGDLALFHNRGTLHTVVGAFAEDQVRMFHQCNLAAVEDPVGPTEEDVAKYA